MNQTHTSSHLISALGWIAAVAAVAYVLFIGKPHAYQAAYQQARAAQAAINVKMVDDEITQRKIEGREYVVLAHFVSASGNQLEIETLNEYLRNPLRPGFRHQRVAINEQTILEKRTLLDPVSFSKLQQEAQAKGVPTEDVQVHKKEPLKLEDLKPGDEIRVYPVNIQDVLKDQFTAKQILMVISTQTKAQTN